MVISAVALEPKELKYHHSSFSQEFWGSHLTITSYGNNVISEGYTFNVMTIA